MKKQLPAFCLAILFTLPVAAQTPASPKAVTKDATPEEVTKMIESKDPAQISAAIDRISAWFSRARVPKDFRNTWLPALIAGKRYDDALTLSIDAIGAAPSTTTVQAILELRAQTFLAMGNPQQALAASKSAYNVCEFRRTEHFIDGVIMAIGKCYPKDRSVMLRFRLEQSDSSGTPASPQDRAATKAADSGPPSPILKTVTIDAAPYAKALAEWKAKDKKNFGDRINYGNLLLIADRGEEAEKLFRELLASTSAPEERAIAVESIARALGAEDGNLARANAFIRSQPAPGATAKPDPTLP